MNNQRVYPRPEYKLYVTDTPYEILINPDSEAWCYVSSVDADTYDEVGVDEEITWYVATEKPCPSIYAIDNLEKEVEFTVAKKGDWYEDDYTLVEVTFNTIIVTSKD